MFTLFFYFYFWGFQGHVICNGAEILQPAMIQEDIKNTQTE